MRSQLPVDDETRPHARAERDRELHPYPRRAAQRSNIGIVGEAHWRAKRGLERGDQVDVIPPAQKLLVERRAGAADPGQVGRAQHPARPHEAREPHGRPTGRAQSARDLGDGGHELIGTERIAGPSSTRRSDQLTGGIDDGTLDAGGPDVDRERQDLLHAVEPIDRPRAPESPAG